MQRKIQYLKRYADLNEKINELQAESDKAYTKAFAESQKISGMPRGGTGENTMQIAVENRIESDQKINKMQDTLVEYKREICAAIKTVRHVQQRKLLGFRYIRGEKWDSIASKIGCSEKSKNVFRLHRRALQNIVIPLDVHH